jgi:hypothetical protein
MGITQGQPTPNSVSTIRAGVFNLFGCRHLTIGQTFWYQGNLHTANNLAYGGAPVKYPLKKISNLFDMFLSPGYIPSDMRPTSPTKQQELDIMKRAIAALGDNSYLGPFLKEQLPFMEHAIRSDMPPTCLADADKMSRDIVAQARAEAGEIVKHAKAKADQIIKGAENYNDNAKKAIKDACETTIHHLNRMGY